RGGIVMPDTHEIPVITGRVIAISKAIENDDDHTIRQYDKVLFDPREAIPVELEHDNRLFVVALDPCWRSFAAPTAIVPPRPGTPRARRKRSPKRMSLIPIMMSNRSSTALASALNPAVREGSESKGADCV